MKAVDCPACGAKGVATVATWDPRRHPENRPVGPCGACGWCAHHAQTGTCAHCGRRAVSRSSWRTGADLPRPRDMGADEFALRAGLFAVWKAQTASELLTRFAIFADWLQEYGLAEEVAARADWQPYAHKFNDPRGWWQWTVPAGANWVTRERVFHEAEWSGLDNAEYTPPGHRWTTNAGRAKITRSYHNGRWFLCWPPGFVRFTAPLYFDHTRWRVTVSANRTATASPSKPIERVWPGGYATLLAPFVAPVAAAAADKKEDPGLFAGLEENG